MPKTDSFKGLNPGQTAAMTALLGTKNVFLTGAAGSGKALALDTPIPTTEGWKPMGSLTEEDRVFGDDGAPCAVTACSDVMVDRPCFAVKFSDGSVIVADGDHTWATLTYAARAKNTRRTEEFRAARREKRKPKSGKRAPWKHPQMLLAPEEPSLVTTTQIRDTLLARHGTHKNHRIQVAGPLVLPDRNLPLAPYLLGAWLGDGHSNSSGFTTADPEMIAEWRKEGFRVTKWSGEYAWGVHKLAAILRRLAILSTGREQGCIKRIPREYLRASAEQRLALLQGLMDSDGCVDPDEGGVEFTTTLPGLRDDVAELITSLGIKAVMCEGVAKLDGRVIGPKWRTTFRSALPLFRLDRKLSPQKREDFIGRHDGRYVTSVEPVPSVPVRCISVNSKTRCFLAGKSMIPTHNSHVIKRYLDSLDEWARAKVAVVASTGAAAILVRGRTFHSFFGLGIMQGGINATVQKASENYGIRNRLKKASVVIADEVSMLDADTLTAANLVAQNVLGNSRPWGGLRIVAVGDFAQLPPVSRSSDRPWCFLSDTWVSSDFEKIYLTESMRSVDAPFLKALNDARVGYFSDDVRALLDARTIRPEDRAAHANKVGTRLYGRKVDVEAYNREQLNKINSPEFVYPTQFWSQYNDSQATMESSIPIPKVLVLRRGALVMIRINHRFGEYVNGSLGVVGDIAANAGAINVKLISNGKTVVMQKHTFERFDGAGKTVSTATNFPLTLAWAATIHKAQGATIDKVTLDLGELWDAGQAYVAMSRVRKAEDMSILRWNRESIVADPTVISFHKELLGRVAPVPVRGQQLTLDGATERDP